MTELHQINSDENREVTSRQKRIFGILILMAVAAFVLFIPPNLAASENLAMVQMFELDEAAPLPTVFRMLAPAATIEKAARSFIFYEYYFYGFPYFALSALSVAPLKWIGAETNLPLVMLILRQFVSVLPMLVALTLLVYMQDGFRSYRSLVLFAFLLSVPAVIRNSFWWHPDGITVLMVTLTLFFLWRDQLHFGRNFVAAAALTGLATATKLVGVYFFLAVGLTLFLGLVLKKASWKKLVGMATAYLMIMLISFVAANPFLLSHWARSAYWSTFNVQMAVLDEGYGVVYSKGLVAAWPIIKQNYGTAVFLLTSIGTAIWSIWRGPKRLLSGLILAWFVPVTVSTIWITHFKSQYWLPAALPIFSCLIVLLPEEISKIDFRRITTYLGLALGIVVVIQWIGFMGANIQIYSEQLHRSENNARIQFYDQAVESLKSISESSLLVYYDYSLYVPVTEGWVTETSVNLLDYDYVENRQFDVLLLLEQRIRDYLNPDVVGIDTNLFAENQRFYRDADSAKLAGYHLIYRNPVGLIYVRDVLFERYLEP